MIRHSVDSPWAAAADCLGVRMSAEEFLALGESPARYELIDGVVCMSPSPGKRHQRLLLQIGAALTTFVEANRLGEVFVELDVHLGTGPQGGDLVYRPDIIFLGPEKAGQSADYVLGAPDLVVEIVSPSSRRMDHETKKNDYERCGVREYWIIDPVQQTMDFYTLRVGRFVPLLPTGDRLASTVVAGFALDLAHVRTVLEGQDPGD